MVFFSTTLTPTTIPQQLLVNKKGIKRVTQISLIVRSMGTATFVACGGLDSQDRRLVTVGDAVSIDAPLTARYLNMSSFFVSSDTADAVLEVIGDTFTGLF